MNIYIVSSIHFSCMHTQTVSKCLLLSLHWDFACLAHRTALKMSRDGDCVNSESASQLLQWLGEFLIHLYSDYIQKHILSGCEPLSVLAGTPIFVPHVKARIKALHSAISLKILVYFLRFSEQIHLSLVNKISCAPSLS